MALTVKVAVSADRGGLRRARYPVSVRSACCRAWFHVTLFTPGHRWLCSDLAEGLLTSPCVFLPSSPGLCTSSRAPRCLQGARLKVRSGSSAAVEADVNALCGCLLACSLGSNSNPVAQTIEKILSSAGTVQMMNASKELGVTPIAPYYSDGKVALWFSLLPNREEDVINELSGKNVDCVVNSDETTASSYRVKKLLALDFGYKFIACSRGCAFMVIYQAGVLKALKELSPEILKSASRVYGVSSGSIVAALAVCKCDMALHTLRNSLNKYLPTNAHQLASGKLHVVLTRARDWQNVVISEFASKEDIIQAIFCSCFLPMYCGFFPPLYHGVRYIDGEFSMRQANFVSETTITVCSFAGEYDICPRGNPVAFFAFQAFGYVLKISKNNIYRFLCALVPPTRQVLDRFYCHGYQDTNSFLERLSEFGISYFAEDFVPAGQGIRSERQRGPVLEAINKDAAKENPVTCWAANGMEEEAQQRLLPQKAPQEKQDVPGQFSKSTKSVLKSIR